MSFRVVEEHNIRQGEATGEEIQQCILDIATWFKHNTELRRTRGVTDEEFQSLEKVLDTEIPQALRMILQEWNGAIWFMESQGLSLQEIRKLCEGGGGGGGLGPGYIPFARDVDDNLLVVHGGSSPNTSHEVWVWSDGSKGDRVESSLSVFLEKYRDDLLSGRYEFIEEIGVVEKVKGSGGGGGKRGK